MSNWTRNMQAEASHALAELGLPPKPRYGTACNGCGLCCTVSLCQVAEMAFPKAAAPCPALMMNEGRTYCGLVVTEIENGLEPMIQTALGVGCGCSMEDEDTTDEEVRMFNALSEQKLSSK